MSSSCEICLYTMPIAYSDIYQFATSYRATKTQCEALLWYKCTVTTLRQGGRGWEIKKKSILVFALYHPFGNFSDTSSLKLLKTKGSIGHAFTVCIHTENQNQVFFVVFFVPHEISVLIELTFRHLRYHLTDVPLQPNSRPDSVFSSDRPANEA